jgi:hypothetical protein
MWLYYVQEILSLTNFIASVVPRLSHLTNCTITKLNLCFATSLAAGFSDPDLSRLLTFQVPNLMSISVAYVIQKICTLSKPSIPFRKMVRFALAEPADYKTTSCQLSASAYSTYWQPPSTFGDRVLHPQPEDWPCLFNMNLSWGDILEILNIPRVWIFVSHL